MKFELITPEKVVFTKEVQKAIIPTKVGQLTILPNHEPLVASLAPGELVIFDDKEQIPVAVSGGFLMVSNMKIAVLADTAERVEELVVERAEAAREKAAKLLEEAKDDDGERDVLMAQIEKELNRIRVAKKYKKYLRDSS